MAKVSVSVQAFMFHAEGDAAQVKAAMDQAFDLLGSVMQAALPSPPAAAPKRSRKRTPAAITAVQRPVVDPDEAVQPVAGGRG